MTVEYRGSYDERGGRGVVVEIDVKSSHHSDLSEHVYLVTHTTSGFEWGNDSGGALQLALAILSDTFSSIGLSAGERLAVDLHQEYMLRAIKPLPKAASWTFTREEVLTEVVKMLAAA